jgi:hypothetical protein
MNEEGDGIFTLTVAVAAGKGALKVTDGTWANAWGGVGAGGNYEFSATEAGEITVPNTVEELEAIYPGAFTLAE